MKSGSQVADKAVIFAIAEAGPIPLSTDSRATISQASTPRTVPELLVRSFAANPVAVAVEFQGRAISRKEIEQRSDSLAIWLLGNKAGAGSLAGIYMDRSVEMMVAVLGVLKAGAAYVPLDPSFPRSRTEQILAETRVSVLLTLSQHVSSLPQSGARVMFMDEGAAPWNSSENQGYRDAGANHVAHITADMVAYVIFTSGSTGTPKGVEVTHGSVANLLISATELLGANPKDRLVAITTLAFDISVLELLLPLVCGGTVILASREEAYDAMRLKELLRSSRATMLQATPVTFRALLELGFEAPTGFKMLCGGEAWDLAMAERLLASGGRLWNMYGPTETTVWSSIVEVERGAKRITFGPPIAGTRFYVMDQNCRMVPSGGEGQLGELWIAGAGVAKGYFRREDLTAERFLLDPFIAGERMYRTGDEVRLLRGGRVEFVGRLDEQVKLRGFRIELGEIESNMLAVQGVSEAVVLLRKESLGEAFLAGFYAGQKRVTNAQLKALLRQKLPEYMVPKVFMRLDAFPLTPNGKTDRRALADLALPPLKGMPVEAAGEYEMQEGRVASESTEHLTRKMFAVWQKLFPDERITADSDFFDLGGDSLLVVRLQVLFAAEFDLRLTMADATEYFTPAGHVQWVEERRSSHRPLTDQLNPAVLPLQRDGKGSPIFIIPQMLNFRTFAEELGHEQPVYGLQIMDEEVTEELASASFEEMAAIYCDLIREVQPEGPYRLAGWCLWGWMAYEVARQLETQGTKVEMLAIIDAWAPGYWSRYSPVRQFFFNASHFGHRITWYADSLRNLPLKERFRDSYRRLSELGASLMRALPRGLRPEMPVVEMLRIQHYASKAAESYRPGPIKANVVLFKSELRPTGQFVGKDMGWGAIVGREVRLDTLPGNHNDIFHIPSARIMATRVRQALGLATISDRPEE